MARKNDPESNPLKPEDRILWEKVARTAKPLSRRPTAADETSEFLLEMQEKPKASVVNSKPAAVKQQSELAKSARKSPDLTVRDLDRPTHRKIAKGRIDIEARIDLHGLTQSDAYELLYGFLADAHARGLRHVMVITGKGRSMGSDGVLRQAVPHWFSTPLFRLLVSAYEDAARHHGGHGALYVRLRRRTQMAKSFLEKPR